MTHRARLDAGPALDDIPRVEEDGNGMTESGGAGCGGLPESSSGGNPPVRAWMPSHLPDRLRWIAGAVASILLFLAGALLFSVAGGGDWGLMIGLFGGFALFMAAATVLGRTLADILGIGAGSIFHPRRRARSPRPVYSILETYRVRGEHSRALEGWRSVVEGDPRDLRAWRTMLEIASADLGDPDLAHGIFSAGLARLASPGDRDSLIEAWGLACETLGDRRRSGAREAPAGGARPSGREQPHG